MFKITGKARHVSREQLRSFLHAAEVVLGYHGLVPTHPVVYVSVRWRIKRGSRGLWLPGGTIYLDARLDLEQMLTTVIHEMIHECRAFPDGTDEKCVSTLTARIKPDVLKIADVLVDGCYRRAAYVAHTKLAYPTKDSKDFYDPAQDAAVGVRPRYLRRK